MYALLYNQCRTHDDLLGSQTMVLDEDVYSQVREAVLEKLGSNAVNLVDDITI